MKSLTFIARLTTGSAQSWSRLRLRVRLRFGLLGRAQVCRKTLTSSTRTISHLFLWDKAALRIAGAYRVGLVDEIVAEHGVMGLYSRSLYKYDEAFINRLGLINRDGTEFHPSGLSEKAGVA